MIRRLMLLVLLLVMPFAASTAHAQRPDQVRQAPDGTIWLVTDEGKLRVSPAPISDEELALIPDRVIAPPQAAVAAPAPAQAGPWLGQLVLPKRDDPTIQIVITAHSITDPAVSRNRFNEPRGRWVVVEWEAQLQGSGPADARSIDLKVQTANGFVIEDGNHAGHPEPEFELDTLAPGQRVRGYLAYDVPLGQPVTSLILTTPGRPQQVVAQL
jgi:hypothetical protein